ncbi:MAG: polysaccharide deacetylase family protein [Candidatus Thorarchaeota archaeon]|nr:MAG: polysaccharide deacetylase family protein [Candidatus Thorarchaeota archaeon]
MKRAKSRFVEEEAARTSYLEQLRRRWGLRAPRQLLKMFRRHRTSFETILANIFEVLDSNGGKFAFPTVAAVAKMRPELVQEIVKEGCEVASHGYNHLRYPTLTPEGRLEDLTRSLKTFKQMGIKIDGFRAPYDNYTDDMPAMLEKQSLVWDGGFGYRSEHREKDYFFNLEIEGRTSGVTYIPLSIWSDDKMIDEMGMNPEAVSKRLKLEVERTSKNEAMVMFDLHPIRIGQPEFVHCLDDVLQHANSLGGWSSTPVEAVRYWNKHRTWKSDATFCLLLTGDIDNWVFSDYLRRVLWKRMS